MRKLEDESYPKSQPKSMIPQMPGVNSHLMSTVLVHMASVHGTCTIWLVLTVQSLELVLQTELIRTTELNYA